MDKKQKAAKILNSIVENQTKSWSEPLFTQSISPEDSRLYIYELDKEEILELIPLIINTESGKELYWFDAYMLINELLDLFTKNFLNEKMSND